MRTTPVSEAPGPGRGADRPRPRALQVQRRSWPTPGEAIAQDQEAPRQQAKCDQECDHESVRHGSPHEARPELRLGEWYASVRQMEVKSEVQGVKKTLKTPGRRACPWPGSRVSPLAPCLSVPIQTRVSTLRPIAITSGEASMSPINLRRHWPALVAVSVA